MSGYTADDIPAIDRALRLIPDRWESDLCQEAIGYLGKLQRRECREWADPADEARHLTLALLLWLARRACGEQPPPVRLAWSLLLAFIALIVARLAAVARVRRHDGAPGPPGSGDTYARLLLIAPCAPPVPALIAGARG